MKLITLISVFLALNSFSDFVGPREVYVSANRRAYAKCVPEGTRDETDKGKTYIYLVERDEDKLVYTFDWYSSRTYVSGIGGITTIRVGSSPSGHEASDQDLGIAIYQGPKLLTKFSMLDLAGTKENVFMWSSHYSVIKRVIGFVDVYKKGVEETGYVEPIHCFALRLHDSRTLYFNILTGKLVDILEDMTIREFSELTESPPSPSG